MKKLNKDVAILYLAAIFAISGASILVPSAKAQNAPAPPASTTKPSVSGPVSNASLSSLLPDDGDGDELAEHWTEPKYSREQRVQLGGMFVLFIVAGASVARRKQSMRRHSHA